MTSTFFYKTCCAFYYSFHVREGANLGIDYKILTEQLNTDGIYCRLSKNLERLKEQSCKMKTNQQ